MAYRFLDDMYDCLAKILKPKVSVIASLLSKKNNNRLQDLDRVKIALNQLSEMSEEVKEAAAKGLINHDSEYIYINAKGIYAVEKERGLFRIDDFIDHLNGKYFDVITKKQLKLPDRRKLIIFFLICIRAFSDGSCLKLNRSSAVLDAIKEYLRTCSEFLAKFGALNEKDHINKMEAKKSENEHLVSNLLRHAVDIQTATDFIFQCPGNTQYFLDLSDNGEVDIEKLAFLLQKIFVTKLSPEDIDEISDFYIRMSFESMIKIYEDLDEHAFRGLKYNGVMKDALLEYNRRYY